MGIRKVLIVAKSPMKKASDVAPLRNFPTHSETVAKVNRITSYSQKIAENFFHHVESRKASELLEMPDADAFVSSFDLVVPIGGDGTFLAAARHILNSNVLVLGVNSNPFVSKGYLLPVKYFPESYEYILSKAFRKILTDQFKTLRRKRFEFRRHNTGQSHLGLNDVLFGPNSLSNTVLYDFKTKLGNPTSIRSTGLLLYTGTGVTAWANSMHFVGPEKVKFIADRLGVNVSDKRIREILVELDEQYQFNPSSNLMGYIHREMIPTSEFESKEGHSDSFEVRVNSLDPVSAAIDGTVVGLQKGEVFTVALTDQTRDLSAVDISAEELFTCEADEDDLCP